MKYTKKRKWAHRIFLLEGMEMPVMSIEEKENLFSYLWGSTDSPDTTKLNEEWFEFPKKLKPMPKSSKISFSGGDKYLLLHFWSPFCKPCVEELPELNQFKKSFKEMDRLEINLIAVTSQKDKALETLTGLAPDLTGIIDQDASIAELYRVIYYPTSYLIGKDRKFICRMPGRIPWMNAGFRKSFMNLLNSH